MAPARSALLSVPESRDSTVPPEPSADGREASHPPAETATEKERRYLREVRSTVRDDHGPRIVALEDDTRKMSERIGRSPDPTIPDDPGTGLSRLIFATLGSSRRVEAAIAEQNREAAAEKARRDTMAADEAKRREPWSTSARAVAVAILASLGTLGAVALVHWALTLHH